MKNMLKIIRKGVTQWALAKISARYAVPWTVISEMSFMQTVFFCKLIEGENCTYISSRVFYKVSKFSCFMGWLNTVKSFPNTE